MLEIQTEDVYEDFNKDKEVFDLVIIQLSQSMRMIRKN